MKRNPVTQNDEGLGFSGAEKMKVDRESGRLSGNQWSGHSNDGGLINKGRGPTRGNQDHKPMAVGKPATKDAYRPVPSCHDASQGSLKPRDVDRINAGGQYRGEAGVAAKSPSNPDRINVSGYDMGDGKMSRGSRPVGRGKMDGINYGPKKQY